MNKEDIIRMAREAELICEETAQTQWKEEYDLTPILERFAVLVASAEREACAKLCEEMRTYVGRNNAVTQSSAQDCATAIRARGQA